jgi:hypothetical protein
VSSTTSPFADCFSRCLIFSANGFAFASPDSSAFFSSSVPSRKTVLALTTVRKLTPAFSASSPVNYAPVLDFCGLPRSNSNVDLATAVAFCDAVSCRRAAFKSHTMSNASSLVPVNSVLRASLHALIRWFPSRIMF